MKERMTIVKKYNGRVEFDKVRGQRINHLIYEDEDGCLIELLEYADI